MELLPETIPLQLDRLLFDLISAHASSHRTTRDALAPAVTATEFIRELAGMSQTARDLQTQLPAIETQTDAGRIALFVMVMIKRELPQIDQEHGMHGAIAWVVRPLLGDELWAAVWSFISHAASSSKYVQADLQADVLALPAGAVLDVADGRATWRPGAVSNMYRMLFCNIMLASGEWRRTVQIISTECVNGNMKVVRTAQAVSPRMASMNQPKKNAVSTDKPKQNVVSTDQPKQNGMVSSIANMFGTFVSPAAETPAAEQAETPSETPTETPAAAQAETPAEQVTTRAAPDVSVIRLGPVFVSIETAIWESAVLWFFSPSEVDQTLWKHKGLGASIEIASDSLFVLQDDCDQAVNHGAGCLAALLVMVHEFIGAAALERMVYRLVQTALESPPARDVTLLSLNRLVKQLNAPEMMALVSTSRASAITTIGDIGIAFVNTSQSASDRRVQRATNLLGRVLADREWNARKTLSDTGRANQNKR